MNKQAASGTRFEAADLYSGRGSDVAHFEEKKSERRRKEADGSVRSWLDGCMRGIERDIGLSVDEEGRGLRASCPPGSGCPPVGRNGRAGRLPWPAPGRYGGGGCHSGARATPWQSARESKAPCPHEPGAISPVMSAEAPGIRAWAPRALVTADMPWPQKTTKNGEPPAGGVPGRRALRIRDRAARLGSVAKKGRKAPYWKGSMNGQLTMWSLSPGRAMAVLSLPSAWYALRSSTVSMSSAYAGLSQLATNILHMGE